MPASTTQHFQVSASWINDEIHAFMQGPDNELRLPSGPEPAFGTPLVGFAAGDDPLWLRYKEVVGEFHWTPCEAFNLAYPEQAAGSPGPAGSTGQNGPTGAAGLTAAAGLAGSVEPGELTVVSWVLPQTAPTKKDNRKEKKFPAERWARARIMGENFVNVGLRTHMVHKLRQAGVQVIAPMLMPQWARMASEKYTFASTWSERHAAHAAGLGTFGLCDGLITPAGKAMRTGSIILRRKLPATPRPYTHHQEYCLFFSSGICGKCIKKCPVGAISTRGHDKIACAKHLNPATVEYVKEHFGFDGYGCGLCQVGVPCESGIPPRPMI